MDQFINESLYMHWRVALQRKEIARSSFTRSRQVCVILVSIVIFGCGVRSTRPKDANQRICSRQMRNIHIAVEQYLNANGDLPLDSVVTDEVKDRNHCWTSFILPNMYETRDSAPYRFDEAWDSHQNTRLGETLHVFTCSDDPGLIRRERSYFLFGELNPEITDPKERYKVVEIHNSGVPRLSPVPETLRAELLSRIGAPAHRSEK